MTAQRLLIIDDDPSDRKIVRRMLKRAYLDMAIDEASSEAEALTHPYKTPQVIILDHHLPGCTGLELLPELHRKWPGVACIMMTGNGDENIAKSAIKTGALDYISKRALSTNALARMIDRCLDMAEMQTKIADHRRELEVFADILVHDLKAPIRAVDFLTTELEEGIEAGAHDDVAQSLRLLRRSALQMRLLVDSLACHVQMNRDVEFEQMPLRDVLQMATFALSRSISESRAQIDVTGPNPVLMCSPPQLAQLFQNVLANAIKFCGDAPPRITLSVQQGAGSDVTITVADAGIGIAEEYLDRVFEPFTRGPSGSETPGSGLGLATCRKVSDRHGGKIWCTSQEGVGTKVMVSLPNNTPLPQMPGAKAVTLRHQTIPT